MRLETRFSARQASRAPRRGRRAERGRRSAHTGRYLVERRDLVLLCVDGPPGRAEHTAQRVDQHHDHGDGDENDGGLGDDGSDEEWTPTCTEMVSVSCF